MWNPRRKPTSTGATGHHHRGPEIPGFHDLRLVFAGQSSVVYRARRDGTQAPIVLKVPRSQQTQQYPTEFDVWQSVANRPGIVPLLALDVTPSGTTYAVLEDYPGSYADQLSHGPVPVDEVVSVGIAVARGLATVHAQGYLHHDVTPENILRAANGPLLTDFGSALPPHVPFPPVSIDATIVRQLPPEALLNAAPTPAADVYRLAGTLWTLAAGHAPFDDSTSQPVSVADYRTRVLTQGPPPAPGPGVPEWFRLTLQHAMAPRPEQRCQTPEELAVALEQASPPPQAGSAHYAPAQPPQPPTEAAPPTRAAHGPANHPTPLPAPTPMPAPTPAPTPTPEPDQPPPGRSRGRRVLFVALAAVAVLVVGGGALLLGRNVGLPFATAEPTPDSSPSASPSPETPEPDPTELLEDEETEPDRAPTQVQIDDGGISVRLSWTDNSAGEATHHVVGGPVEQPVTSLAATDEREESVEIIGLNPDLDYCFTVVALLDGDTTAPGTQTCTTRDENGVPEEDEDAQP